jgi:hydrogenase expression/formation protein HypC
MCLAVPGKLVSILGDDPIFRSGKVSFEGVEREINLAFVPEAKIGDYVLVHVGFAISQVDEKEAKRIYKTLKELGDLEAESL